MTRHLSAVFTLGLLLAGCDDPAKGKSKAQVSDRLPSESRGVTSGSEVLPIAAGDSKVTFVGSKVTGRHEGGFQKFQGQVQLAPELEKSRLEVTIDMDSVFSDSEKLTGHLKSADFFDVATYPTATFVTTAIQKGGGGGATHTVTGTLKLHGVEKSITFPATIRVTPRSVEAESEFVLNRKDFGVSYPGMKDDLIRDEVVLGLSIRAAREARTPAP